MADDARLAADGRPRQPAGGAHRRAAAGRQPAGRRSARSAGWSSRCSSPAWRSASSPRSWRSRARPAAARAAQRRLASSSSATARQARPTPSIRGVAGRVGDASAGHPRRARHCGDLRAPPTRRIPFAPGVVSPAPTWRASRTLGRCPRGASRGGDRSGPRGAVRTSRDGLAGVAISPAQLADVARCCPVVVQDRRIDRGVEAGAHRCSTWRVPDRLQPEHDGEFRAHGPDADHGSSSSWPTWSSWPACRSPGAASRSAWPAGSTTANARSACCG